MDPILNATLAEWLGIDIAHFEAGSLTLGDVVRGENVSLLAGVLAETGHDRTEWWARAVEVWPDYEAYQRKTKRVIPLFVLEPAEG